MVIVFKIYQFQAQASVLQTTGRWQYLAILLLTLCILFAACPVYCTDYYVAPDGNDNNNGTIGNPFKTITKAHSMVVAGDTIYLRGGVHYYDSKISITKNGASGNRITLRNYQNETVILDFNEQPRGGSSNRAIQMSASANYWHLKGFTIRYAGDNALYTNSSHNIFEQLVTHSNYNTGVQIRANASGSPAYNQVINCDSYLNFDPDNYGENADGFGAKGTTGGADSLGPGNEFVGCRAWNNSDDGYDFWWAGNGVTVEDCWSFRNGENLWEVPDPCFGGDGQGFKLGQGGGEHVLIRCMSYNNQHSGFDLNRSTTDATGVTLYNCTGVNNLDKNFKFNNPTTGAIHVLRNNLSYLGTVTIGTLIDDANNSWNYGTPVTAADFASLDPHMGPIGDPNDYNNADSNGIDGPRGPNGELPKLDFLRLARGSWLINAGIDVGEPFEAYAPDLGAFEYDVVTFVDADATGANDGSSWENAYNYLQDALDDAQPGDQIWVAEGTHKPDANSAVPNGTGDRYATFQLRNGVAVYGGYAGFGEPDPNARDFELYETILSGDLEGNDRQGVDPCDLLSDPCRADNSYHVVTGSGTEPNAILDGFTITAGNANGAGTYGYGGGMFNNDGDPTVTNCTFSGNSTKYYGGGMFNYGDSMVANCTFSGNSSDHQGGGMYNYYGDPTLTNCTFYGNSAKISGGGMYNYESSPTLTNCTFSSNVAGYGGGMGNIYNSNPTLTNCTFSGNSAEYQDAHGGGMVNNYSSSPTLTNCTFSGNWAENNAGGMQNYDSDPTLTNCTFSGNSAGVNGGGMYNNNSSPTLTNCILWDNSDSGGTDESAQIYNVGGSTAVVNYCCVQGWTGGLGGTGNIGDDPMFVDANGLDNIAGTQDDNLRLSMDSNCIDAGDNTAVPADTTDLDNDGNTTEPIPWDLEGHPRFVDGDCNDTEIVDMGAYEFAWTYMGDFAGGCDVDFVDFTYLALTWLKEDGDPEYDYLCDISIPADSRIDERDLKIFTDNWLVGK